MLSILSEGTFRGIPARVSLLASREGCFVEKIDCPIGQVQGFDGTQGWRVDHSGLLQPLELEDLEIFRVSNAVWTGAWRTFARDGSHELRVPGGRYPFLLRIDPQTQLPRALIQPGEYECTTHYEDYRDTPWGPIAHRTITRVGWLSDELRASTITEAGEGDFAPPASNAVVRFEVNAPSSLPLQRTRRGHLPLVRVEVDGHDAGLFLIDTGAESCAIDAALADRLELATLGRVWVTTSDGGTGAAHRIAKTLRVGPLLIERPVMLELDMLPIAEALSTKVVGILGFDVFARAVMRLSAQSSTLELLKAAPSHFEWRPMRLENRVPMLECTCPFGHGLLALDTGSSAEALFYPAAIAEWGVPIANAKASRARGATGFQPLASTKLAWIEVAGRRFEHLQLSIAASKQGVAASSGKLGTIGWSLVKHCDVWLDYAGGRVALHRP